MGHPATSLDVRPVLSTVCVVKLARGEYKRVPLKWPKPVGYHVACPVCKRIVILLAEAHNPHEVCGVLVNLDSWRCAGCKGEISIVGGRFVRRD